MPLLATTRRSSWATPASTASGKVFDGLDTDIRTVVCGHTHMPFVRLAHGDS
jgi:hypothetical protein